MKFLNVICYVNGDQSGFDALLDAFALKSKTGHGMTVWFVLAFGPNVDPAVRSQIEAKAAQRIPLSLLSVTPQATVASEDHAGLQAFAHASMRLDGTYVCEPGIRFVPAAQLLGDDSLDELWERGMSYAAMYAVRDKIRETGASASASL